MRADDNTVAAIEAAVREGASGVEVDVRITGDGVPVLSHDDDVEGLSIATSTLDELKQASPSLATLEEGLEASSGIGVDLEYKGPVMALDPLVRSLGLVDDFEGPVLISSFWMDLLHVLHDMRPDFAYGVLTSPEMDPGGDIAVKLARQGGFEVALPHDGVIDQDLVSKAQDAGLEVIAWTVNDSDRMRELKGFGVSGIITDDPARAVEVLSE